MGVFLYTDANLATKWVLNVCIAHSAVFILWICGGASCTTVLSFCKSNLNSVDNSLSKTYNFGACPAFFNLSYKTSYACNMSVSLLAFMGSTNIALVCVCLCVCVCVLLSTSPWIVSKL